MHLTKKNLELGAGCGTFGTKFISDCLITEENEEIWKTRCDQFFIEYFCSACDTKLPDNYFGEIYACNPYGYGFLNDEESELFLKEIARIIKNDGKLVILSTGSSKYSNPVKVKRAVEKLSMETKPNHQIEIYVAK